MKSVGNIGLSPGITTALYVTGGALIIGIAYFGIVKPVFEFVGIKDSREDKENKSLIEKGSKSQYWSPSYWKENPGKLTYAEANYLQFAKNLYDATTGWGTNEEAIYGVFRKLTTAQDISRVADIYFIRADKDLYQVLVDELDLEELATLQNIINNFVSK